MLYELLYLSKLVGGELVKAFLHLVPSCSVTDIQHKILGEINEIVIIEIVFRLILIFFKCLKTKETSSLKKKPLRM